MQAGNFIVRYVLLHGGRMQFVVSYKFTYNHSNMRAIFSKSNFSLVQRYKMQLSGYTMDLLTFCVCFSTLRIV